MKVDHYEASHERRRLSGMMVSRRLRHGISTLGGIWVGSVFALVGIFIILIGTKTLPVDPSTVHAPYWVLTVCGIVFAFGGIMVWTMTWRQHCADRHSREAARQHPDEPALQDYNWDSRGFTIPRWKPVIIAFGITIFLAVFLSSFNWWAFVQDGPMMVKGIVIFLDLFWVLTAWRAARRFGHALKFGGSKIQFVQFPYLLSQPVKISWQPTPGIVQVNKGSFTLRCVEEWVEVTGRGKNRRSRIVQEELWSETGYFDHSRTLQRMQPIDLQFEIPAELPPTRLNAERAIFWELDVKLDLPGLDFEERYLVPIYASSAMVSSET